MTRFYVYCTLFHDHNVKSKFVRFLLVVTTERCCLGGVSLGSGGQKNWGAIKVASKTLFKTYVQVGRLQN